ncbi:biopolymer transporter ExbD [Mucisphaera calidilacus]|uniref:Biopolymer transport protein ExbD/TolR n=1 Tax=Mucisphaera calidilacus TaxID=2527982 RepID=A0A518BUU1_9BACT|nr:biopolymer transporter ExbD [Mucisphaera calidilacus]QDU70717.1 Biopolymer transport protein ExbD/TolR [Mucisphaera calidilacus]
MKHHRQSRFARRSSVGSLPVALVDVVFLLLIYFVVALDITPDRAELDMPLPSPDPAAATPERLPVQPMRIEVVATAEGWGATVPGRLGYATDLVTFKLAVERLVFDPEARGPTGYVMSEDPVLLSMSDGLPWDLAVNLADAARQAGLRAVALDPEVLP